MSEINQTDLNLNTDFTNRESQFPNRRIIKIISQTPNEIIADIERDEGNVSNNGTKINAEQFQNIETKLNNLQTQVTNKQGTIVKINEVSQENINFESDPQTQINNIFNNLSKIKNSYGGFSAGQNSNATYGVAVGNGANTSSGVSIGNNARAGNGVAVGVSAKTGDGFAGGYQAKTVNENGVVIDAIQLGTGTNTQEKTLQVYNDNIYNANSHTLNVQSASINSVNAQLGNISEIQTNSINLDGLGNLLSILNNKLQVAEYYIDPSHNQDNADIQSMSYVVINNFMGSKKLILCWGATPETDGNGYLNGAPTGVGWIPTSSDGSKQLTKFTKTTNYRVFALPYYGTQFSYGWRVINYLNSGYGGFNIRYGNETSGIRFNYFVIGLED